MDASFRLGQCEWERCFRSLEAARSTAREIGVTRIMEEIGCLSAAAHVFTGNVGRALEEARDVSKSAVRGDQQTQALGLLTEGLCLYFLGDRDRLQGVLHGTKSIMDTPPGSSIEAWYHALLALVSLERLDGEGALNELSLTRDLLRRGSSVVWCRILTHACLSEACGRLLEHADGGIRPEDSRRVLDVSRGVLQLVRQSARALSACRPRALRLEAGVSWHRGQSRQALAAWQEGAELASRLGMPYDEACAWMALGLHLNDDAGGRRACLERAEKLLETTCEWSPLLEDIRSRLGRSQ
jgi:hypothetical protein